MKYANFTDDDVPTPRPHRNRYLRRSTNASGRTCIYTGRDRWLASDTTVAVRR